MWRELDEAYRGIFLVRFVEVTMKISFTFSGNAQALEPLGSKSFRDIEKGVFSPFPFLIGLNRTLMIKIVLEPPICGHMFGVMLWKIWKHRCTLIFNGESWSSEAIIQSAHVWAISIASRSVNGGPHTVRPTNKQTRRPPALAFSWLNTGGAVNQRTMRAASGGILRNHEGSLEAGS
ncbi:uncharacterized protein LOC120182982 [Hibiscus syriacus]|uniref:uncharacterized protein LOC120182982 n=1 Tax=Hibiscus syriacus TaxID=106335 RepID=UPI0019247382|nr:uncharacterized protein LOC120182982 [Hibiscus syriacus]